MKSLIIHILGICCMLFLTISCTKNPLKVDISGIDEEVKVIRFNKELFSFEGDTLNKIVELSNTYPDFFNLFTHKIIRIGGPQDELFPILMKKFINDTLIVSVNDLAEEKFGNLKKTEKELIRMFKYYRYHFPDKDLPEIYIYVSGFNQSVVTTENFIGISLDKYFGRDCNYYRQLSTTPQYKIKNMHPMKIPSDVAYAWAITDFNDQKTTTNLLDNIIHQGKLMYFTDAVLPSMHDSLKIGYTKEQLDWCEDNEAQMWNYLVERKMLYSNKRMDIIRYINDGPTTSGFPLESPSRTGVWIGWQIVRQYMKKHPEVTVAALMKDNDYQEILNASGYFPE